MENTGDIQKDLLTDESHPLFRFTSATRGQRFFNFLIDNLFMRFGLTYITAYPIGYLLALTFPDFTQSIINGSDKTSLFLLAYIIGIFNYVIYYTLSEKFFRGHTLGKAITGTRAIRTDGEELTFKNALLRSLSRLVPFEPFSGFGDLWHDTWTNTMVIKK